MAQFYQRVITNKGLRLISKTQAGAKIEYTRISTGDGQWPAGTNFLEVEDLKNLKQSIGISSIAIIDNTTVRVRGLLRNDDLTEGYYIREIGFYALDPDEGEILFAIVTAITSDFFPSNNQMASIVIDTLVTVSNAESISITVSSGAVATAMDVQELRQTTEQHSEDIDNLYQGLVDAKEYTDQEVGALAGEGRTDETVKNNADNIKNLAEDMDDHKDSIMPHIMINNQTSKTYRYGYRVSSQGIPQIISEEVII